MRQPTSLFVFSLLLTLLPALASTAADSVNVSDERTASGAPLALLGYDPVAYFQAGHPERGKAEHTAVYDGVAYRFATAESLVAFEAEPTRYLPLYGGFCAYGVARGGKYDGDPEVWTIVDGKLYLNLSRSVQKRWNKDVPGFLAKSDVNWREIRDKSISEVN